MFTEATYRRHSFGRFYLLSYFNIFPDSAGRKPPQTMDITSQHYHQHKSGRDLLSLKEVWKDARVNFVKLSLKMKLSQTQKP